MREVADGVFDVPITYVHAFFVVVDDGVVVIDTGLPGKSAKLRAALAQAHRSLGEVHTILLTHFHADHTGAAAELKRATGATVVAHRLDAPVVSGAKPAPLGTVAKLAGKLVGAPEPVRVDRLLTEDGAMPVPGFTAFHTPGHTDGHVSYLLDRSGGVLFAGDAASGGKKKLSYTPKPMTADRSAARSSVARLAGLDFRVAVFGHGPAVTDRAVDRFRELASRRA